MALTAAALVLAIPVFFDVGFIILVPIVYGFCKAAGVNPIKFGLPVAGIMLAAHVVVPPHPGIVGGAAIVKGDWLDHHHWPGHLHPAGGAGAGRRAGSTARGYPMLPTTAEQFAAFGWQPRRQHGIQSPQRTGRGHHHGADPDPAGPHHGGHHRCHLLPKGDSLRNVLGFIGSPIFALMVAVGLAMFCWAAARAGTVSAPTPSWNPPCPCRHRDPGDGRGRRVC